MAFKQPAQRADTVDFGEEATAEAAIKGPTIRVKISGLKSVYGSESLFDLEDVTMIDMDLGYLISDFVEQGVDRMIAETEVEKMMEAIHMKTMGMLLASRIKVHHG